MLAQGCIGLRVPQLGAGAAWFSEVLRRAPWPVPTTSVNVSGQPPYTQWADAARFLASRADCYVPPGFGDDVPQFAGSSPSTIVKLAADGSYTVVRAGAMRSNMIDEALHRAEGEAHV
jgi:tRNA A37 threonylcarbamoyladenosine synthetase subunit TsaC/SUA5/YrdC